MAFLIWAFRPVSLGTYKAGFSACTRGPWFQSWVDTVWGLPSETFKGSVRLSTETACIQNEVGTLKHSIHPMNPDALNPKPWIQGFVGRWPLKISELIPKTKGPKPCCEPNPSVLGATTSRMFAGGRFSTTCFVVGFSKSHVI